MAVDPAIRPRVRAMGTRHLIAMALLIPFLVTACGTSVFDLEVGQCFDDPDSFEAVADVDIVSCDQAHDNEVYAIEQISGGGNWPGQDLVADAADEACLAAFEAYVGIDYLSSSFEIGWLAPTSDSWADGDREVVCFLFDPTLEPITGSVEDSGR